LFAGFSANPSGRSTSVMTNTNTKDRLWRIRSR
jgi:hypothetical protein